MRSLRPISRLARSFRPLSTRLLPQQKLFKNCLSSANAHSISRTHQKQKTKMKTQASAALDMGALKCAAFCTGGAVDSEKFTLKLTEWSSSSFEFTDMKYDEIENVFFFQNTLDKVNDSISELFLFADLGVFVGWNMTVDQLDDVRSLIQQCQKETYEGEFIEQESEFLAYKDVNIDQSSGSKLEESETLSFKNGVIYMNSSSPNCILHKLALSNALALSTKLSYYEYEMDLLIEKIRHVPDNLKNGDKTHLSRKEILMLAGEIQNLRLLVNLDSEFLNIKDLFWEYDDLSRFFMASCNYLNMTDRTSILNERINDCQNIVDLLRSHMNENHSHNLEWLIILLISVEVVLGLIKMAGGDHDD